jgi:hypothetical protein
VRDISKQLAVPEEQLRSGYTYLISSGRVVSVAEAPADAAEQNVVLAQRTGDHVRQLAPTDESARTSHVNPVAAYALPISFKALARLPGETKPRPVSFEAIVLVLSALRFHETVNRFEAQIAVGLRNPAAPTDRSVLEEAVELLVHADADEVSPQELRIDRLGDPQIVRIATISPAVPFVVSARTLLDTGDSIELPVERPTIAIQAARQSIEGWGLGKTTIQLQAYGLQNPRQISVTLSTTQGDITPTPVVLGPDGHATAQLRSEGTGSAVISAASNPFEHGATHVEFTTPWRFLLATLIGALVGWVARTRLRNYSIRSLAVAVASALILAAAYAIGIRWLQWTPEAGAGEALAFFVAAIAAYSGMSVLKAN